MAKFVQDIHDLAEFLAGKNIATKYAPEKIDLKLYEVSLDLFTSYYDHYAKTQKISRFLMPFIRKVEQDVTGGRTPVPGDFEFNRRLTLHDDKTRVELIEDHFWDKRVNRKLGGPSLTRPIARIEDIGGDEPELSFEVVPSTIDKLIIYYFKKVNKPKYAYTKSGTRYVYDDGASVDVEWSHLLFPELMTKTLNGLGINLREQQVIQYTEQMRQQQGMK